MSECKHLMTDADVFRTHKKCLLCGKDDYVIDFENEIQRIKTELDEKVQCLARLEAAASDAADLLEFECEKCKHYIAEHCIADEGYCDVLKVAKEIRDALQAAREGK